MRKWIAIILTVVLGAGLASFASAEAAPTKEPDLAVEAVQTMEPITAEEPAVTAEVQEPEAIQPEPAQPVPEGRSVNIPIFAENVILNLPRNSMSFWFTVPNGTQLQSDAVVRLHMEVSDTLINERSSITLSVNGEQLSTIHILDIIGQMNGWWDVTVPADILRTDGTLNELGFSTVQRSIEGDCADIDNPSNWVKLMDDSYLQLTVSKEGEITLANAMTYMYDTLENTGAISAEFIIADTAGDAERSALLQAAASAGASYPYHNDVNLAVSDAEQGSQRNKLYIGLNLSQVLPVPALNAGQGFLAVDRQDGVNRMVITGADAQGLNRAVRVLGNSMVLNHLQTQSATMEETVPLDASPVPYREDGYYTLEDFGYADVNLAGAFHQQTFFTLPQPGGMVSGENSYIEVHFRHSEALISDNSLMTLYINNSPIGSAKLSASNAKAGKLKVTLPREALEQETIDVRIDVYNYLGKLDCSKDYYDTAWTVIEKASVVYYEPGTEPVIPSLSGFPRLSSDTCMVIADSSSMALAATVALRGGQQNGHLQWLAAGPDALDTPRGDADYIILSDNQSLSLPQSLEDALPVLPLGGRSFRIQEETGLISAVVENKLLVQAVRAPWSDHGRVYVITYPAGWEDDALYLLSQRDVTSGLDDQISLVPPDGDVSTVSTARTIAQNDPPLTWERIKYLVKTKTGYSIELLGLVALILLVIIILIIRASVNRSRFKRAAQGVQDQNKTPQTVEKPVSPPTAPSESTEEPKFFPKERYLSKKE